MAAELGLVDAFSRLHVLVIGEAMLDTYLDGKATRLSREGPVPIVAIDRQTDVAGGAANAAANLVALGARVSFLSLTGDDDAAGVLRMALRAQGVPDDNVVSEPGRRTLTKRRISADGQLLLRFDEGSTQPASGAVERDLIDRLESVYETVDAVLISDYGYGVLTSRLVDRLGDLLKRRRVPVVVDAKDPTAYRNLAPTAAKPNYAEAAQLLGEPVSEASSVRIGQIARGAGRLLELTGAQVVAVTLDRDGALVFERAAPVYRTYAEPNPHSRAAGAGDTFVSVMALGLTVGAETSAVAEAAAAASSIVVDKSGTATCTADELRARLCSGEKVVADRRVLATLVAGFAAAGRRVVLTNGCFDILHRGHITYLNRAKALGDVLIVGLNTDDGVRRLKGDGRPINSLDDRAQVLAGLSAVDYIVPFAEDTAVELAQQIRPD